MLVSGQMGVVSMMLQHQEIHLCKREHQIRLVKTLLLFKPFPPAELVPEAVDGTNRGKRHNSGKR